MTLLLPGQRGGGTLDEHCGSLPQQAGDVRILQSPLLCRAQGVHQSLPRDSGGGAAGEGGIIN